MRTMASPLLPGRDGDDLPPLPFASRPAVALIVAAGDEPIPLRLGRAVAIGTDAGGDLLPRRAGQRGDDDDNGAHDQARLYGARMRGLLIGTTLASALPVT
jgi:hypothetical protein